MKLPLILRITLSLSWIYHGLVPKLLHVAPMEKAITATLGFNGDISFWITKAAGIGEVVFGLILFFGYRNVLLLKLNIAALLGLLAYVALFIPSYLFEAFNPVTTNIPLIVISLALIKDVNKMGSESLSNDT